jgi:hypothetical protein
MFLRARLDIHGDLTPTPGLANSSRWPRVTPCAATKRKIPPGPFDSADPACTTLGQNCPPGVEATRARPAFLPRSGSDLADRAHNPLFNTFAASFLESGTFPAGKSACILIITA